MRSFLAFVLRHRLAVVVAVLLVTLAAGASLSRVVIASSMDDLFLGQAPGFAEYQATARAFGSDEIMLVGYEAEDPLDPALLARLERVVDRVRRIPDVGTVDSVLDRVFFEQTPEGVRASRYADEAARHPETRRDLAARLAADPAAGGLVISSQGRHGAVLVALSVDPARPAERGPMVVGEVLDAFEAEGFAPEELHTAGYLALLAQMMVETIRSMLIFVPLSAVVVAVVVFVIFRRLLPVVIASGISGLAAFWSMGFSVLLERELSVFMGLVPVVVMVVAVSDVIHLWSAALLQLEQHGDVEEAILASGEEVGPACLLTSATTFVGFAALCLIPVPVYQQLGIVLAFGVTTALLLAVTLMPVVLSLVKMPPRAPPVPGVDRLLAGVLSLSTRRAPWVLAATTGVMAVLAVGVARYTIDLDLVQRMPADSATAADHAWFDDQLSGTNLVEVFVETAEAGGALEPELLAGVVRAEERLEDLEGVAGVTSVADVLGALSDALGGLPPTRAATDQALLLLELGGQDLEGLVDEGRQKLRVLVRVEPTAVRATHELRQQIDTILEAELGPDVVVEATGVTSLLGAFIDEVLLGEAKGLLVGLVLITVMMMVGLRSVRVGLLSMVPNLLPVLALVGTAGLIWRPADVETVVFALIALGIGVDDTIHMLVRLRTESARHPPAEALEQSFHFAGRAIVYTTVILTLGMLPMALGDYSTMRSMGTLLPLAWLVALAADLVVVPALVTVGWLRFPAIRP